MARGSGKFHFHRHEILRAVLDRPNAEQQLLSDFLAGSFFSLPEGWSVFTFEPKDWKLCERLLSTRHPGVEDRLLEMLLVYAAANEASVARLYDLGATISERLLRREAVDVDPDSDLLTPIDAQSLFGLRLGCASNHSSTDTMMESLRKRLPKGWARSRLVHPMVYHFSNTPPAAALDNFLSYVVTGKEHDAEKLALKLLLSDEAARDTSLAFKCFVGLMGHPYDAIEFVLDHVEHEFASGRGLSTNLAAFVAKIAEMQPRSRAVSISATLGGSIEFIDGTRANGLTTRFRLPQAELERYAALCCLAPVEASYEADAARPYDILTNMRMQEYPDPLQFQLVTVEHAVWHFVDAGRLIGSLLRSIYMIERAAQDLEVRDSFRLLYLLGFANPFIASMPSGITLIRRLAAYAANSEVDRKIEETTHASLVREAPFTDRLWINELQWRLRRLEERGFIQEWLSVVRSQTRLRPSYLTGINWHWVEEVIALQRLKPFRSYDGAYLFIHMELETNSDPLRLRLTLDPLIKNLDDSAVVEKIIEEFGASASALVRRYLTTQNLIASGMAPNYLAALDQRVRALESCIREFGFGPLLSEDVYESEVKALTAELLLTDVNTGKFEVPWETFRNDANDRHQDLYRAVESLRPRMNEAGPLTAVVDTPLTFPNGYHQVFRVRIRDQPLFALVLDVLAGFMQHPAFGLEVILSGRFRHNNLLQELWSALADVVDATIPSVSRQTQATLVEQYKIATERFIDSWCAARLQTRRPEKEEGLFDLVPEPKELDQLLARAREADGMLAITDVVIEYVKDKLRKQIADARAAFEREVGSGLVASFKAIKESQESEAYRAADIQLVHLAVNDATLRKVEDLTNWFDGVDSTTSGPISLGQLSLAAEALFENMIPGRTLKVSMDGAADDVSFEPEMVKIAFDLLREVYFNALRHGIGPEVVLTIRKQPGTVDSFAFTNDAEACPSEKTGERAVEGHVYHSRNEAVTREGNSGLAKIAASSATLVGRDTSVLCRREERSYEVVVSLMSEAKAVRCAS
jgi:hypothetical protein